MNCHKAIFVVALSISRHSQHTQPHLAHTDSHTQEFDDAQYSEVRKGPFYVPKGSPTPIADGTITSPPPPASTELDDNEGGLSELDNLLAMLNDTQLTIQEGNYSSGNGAVFVRCVD